MIEKIKAEIERLKKEYEVRPWEEVTSHGVAETFSELLSFIESLDKEQPQGLDEAAEEYTYGDLSEEERKEVECVADSLIDAFKAGAEWQREQGETHNEMVYAFNGDGNTRYISGIFLSPKNFELADKVIVQIRKKENNR